MPAQLENCTLSLEDTPYARLTAMGTLQTEIEHALHDTANTQEPVALFDNVVERISRWIDDARLIVFALEQDITQDSNSDAAMDTQPIEEAIDKMKPVIDRLMDVFDERTDALRTRKIHVTNIQSIWSQLQHFYKSVKQRATSVSEQKELATLMDQILVDIDDLSIIIFQFQEGRVCHSNSNNSNSAAKSDATDSTQDGKEVLAEIDDKVSPLFSNVEKVYTRMTSTPPNEASDKLERKHRLVQEKWECLRIDIDELKDDLKEDRWLAVFRQVADQVDTMIDGLDKAVCQCYELIQQVRGWYAAHSVSSPQYQPKSILRSAPKSYTSNGSISSTFSSNSPTTPTLAPVDHAKFKSVEKNFTAKYKYYTPSVQRMLGMLGQGIHSRVSRNNATVERHEAMMERWKKLEAHMKSVLEEDLPDAEKILLFERPISPTWSRISDRSERSQMSAYRSLESFDCRSPGLKSPYSKGFGALPSPASTYFPDESRRGRSTTPNSGSSQGSRDYWRTVNGGSPSPVYGRTQQRTVSSMSCRREPPRTLRPSTSDAKPMVPKRPKSSMDRPKSSMGQQQGVAEYDMLPYRERSTTPVRRSATPSLIPRPKTPSSASLLSPSLIPRPRSSLRSPLPSHGGNGGGGGNPPYGFLQVVSNDSDDSHPSNSSFLSVPDSSPPSSPPSPPLARRMLRKKQSMPAFLTPRNESPFRRTRVPLARTPPPQHSLFDDEGEEEEEEEEAEDRFRIAFKHDRLYIHDPKDELDKEVARIVNSSPIVIKCRRVPQSIGGYYFGNEKMYTCKLMKYGSNRRGNTASNKVLVRVGGGWQDLEIFLLEHHHLMASDVIVRSFMA